MKIKKVIAAVLVIASLAAAGAAFAAERAERENAPKNNYKQFRPCWGQRGACGFGFCEPFAGKKLGDRFRFKGSGAFRSKDPSRFAPDMPNEIREKTAEAAKLRIDLENVMTKRPLDREKAAEIYAKIAGIESEIKIWRFSKKLDGIEKFEKARREKIEKIEKFEKIREAKKIRPENPEKPNAPEKPEKFEKPEELKEIAKPETPENN